MPGYVNSNRRPSTQRSSLANSLSSSFGAGDYQSSGSMSAFSAEGDQASEDTVGQQTQEPAPEQEQPVQEQPQEQPQQQQQQQEEYNPNASNIGAYDENYRRTNYLDPGITWEVAGPVFDPFNIDPNVWQDVSYYDDAGNWINAYVPYEWGSNGQANPGYIVNGNFDGGTGGFFTHFSGLDHTGAYRDWFSNQTQNF